MTVDLRGSRDRQNGEQANILVACAGAVAGERLLLI